MPTRPVVSPVVQGASRLDLRNFVRRTFSMLPRLVHDCGRQELHGIEVRNREAINPRLVVAAEASQLRPAAVPHMHVHPV